MRDETMGTRRWRTGFDALCVHTLYIDKPMKGHNLMQAIARMNEVFGDRQGGLVVDYIGIANALKWALPEYTASKGRGPPWMRTWNEPDAVHRTQCGANSRCLSAIRCCDRR